LWNEQQTAGISASNDQEGQGVLMTASAILLCAFAGAWLFYYKARRRRQRYTGFTKVSTSDVELRAIVDRTTNKQSEL
jgi:hypothetical protein